MEKLIPDLRVPPPQHPTRLHIPPSTASSFSLPSVPSLRPPTPVDGWVGERADGEGAAAHSPYRGAWRDHLGWRLIIWLVDHIFGVSSPGWVWIDPRLLFLVVFGLWLLLMGLFGWWFAINARFSGAAADLWPTVLLSSAWWSPGIPPSSNFSSWALWVSLIDDVCYYRCDRPQHHCDDGRRVHALICTMTLLSLLVWLCSYLYFRASSVLAGPVNIRVQTRIFICRSDWC